MKIVAMVPVRHEAWVLPHSLAALSTIHFAGTLENGLRGPC